MVNTFNHNYNAPDAGTSDWHIPLNENFEQLDVDVEIRGSEADKGDYEPKEGAKYEATDSGAVYYGNGTSWVLADRKLSSLESDSFSTGEHLKAGDSSTAIVAPSVGSAFDGIQEAIDAGHRDIILAEEITEAGIMIPRGDAFRLQGVGQNGRQVINDPGIEKAVIKAEPGDTRGVNSYVTIKDIEIDKTGWDSGIAILGAKNIEDPEGPVNAAGNWHIRNVISRAGPIYLCGPRNVLIHVVVANNSDRLFPIPSVADEDGNSIYDRAGGYFRGATFGQYGGAIVARRGAKSSAYYANGAYTISGGTTYSNSGEKMDRFYSSNLNIMGSSRGIISGISGEATVDYGIQFGVEGQASGPGDACADTLITGNSAFGNINIQRSCQNVHIDATTDTTIRKEQPATIYFRGNKSVEYEDGHNPLYPHEITHLNPIDSGVHRIGGNRNSPPTTLGLQIQSSPPEFPQEGTFALADGGDWDPTGNGNAVLVGFDTDGEWKAIFEYSDQL